MAALAAQAVAGTAVLEGEMQPPGLPIQAAAVAAVVQQATKVQRTGTVLPAVPALSSSAMSEVN